ncbi:hypothetical protein C5167_004468 [Papaver somniferum]|uniref:Bet v I/Major latex protein domain-containing protein n=1 Tax=Papaver somniferum TaxID=3469 RepID=A0A4Y7J7Q5_PAPSO|nr:MLP-like protein 43 [Papaver somniferum]RZC57164.1 hypothetical protein C5167_004468 [Papaver somniferum]
MAAQIREIQVELKAKCSAEKLFALITRDAPKLPKYVPQMIHNCQVLPGDGEVRVGSVYVWDYVQEGKPSALRAKETITAVDHKNMSLTFTVSEGDHITNFYNNFSSTVTINPTQRDGDYNCLVKWSVQYEKANEDVPDPTYVNKWVEDFTKELDTNLPKEQ